VVVVVEAMAVTMAVKAALELLLFVTLLQQTRQFLLQATLK
jgi:hypothetical protein